jgi:hypothetical protein
LELVRSALKRAKKQSKLTFQGIYVNAGAQGGGREQNQNGPTLAQPQKTLKTAGNPLDF